MKARTAVAGAKCILAIHLLLFFSACHAGGDGREFIVTEFSSNDGDELVVTLIPVIKGSDFPAACASLTISGEYASLFWFFNSGVGPSKTRHEAALVLLGGAFASKQSIEFGWVGDGIDVSKDSPACSASSRGSTVEMARGREGVYSYFKWP